MAKKKREEEAPKPPPPPEDPCVTLAKRVNWLKWEINFEMENLKDYENRGKEKAIVITKRTIEKYKDELQERTGDRWNILINQ